jgi:hypothetical protein
VGTAYCGRFHGRVTNRSAVCHPNRDDIDRRKNSQSPMGAPSLHDTHQEIKANLNLYRKLKRTSIVCKKYTSLTISDYVLPEVLLEIRLPEAAKVRKWNRQTSLRAVLDEQSSQLYCTCGYCRPRNDRRDIQRLYYRPLRTSCSSGRNV